MEEEGEGIFDGGGKKGLRDEGVKERGRGQVKGGT